MANLHAAWIGFLLGCLAGAVPGMFFHAEGWLGGYASWPRRMLRLAHVAFFGIGFVNLSFALTARALGLADGLALPSALLLAAAAAMPAVCYAAAFRPGFRRLFPVPASCLTLGIALFLWRLVRP
jgi:hypothetical protein